MVETTPDDVHAEMKESASTTSSEEVHTSPAATTHSASDQTHESAGYCLLALDGGGVRGLSTLFILQNIMNRLNYIRSRAGLQPKKPCDIFDLIGGTSTGGLIAIMLGRLQMSVEECITAYVTLMKEVFEKRINRSRIDFRGKVKPQFSSTVLKEAISKVVRGCGVPLDEKFDNGSEPRCKVFVCTNLQATNTIARLRNYRTASSGCDFQPTIIEAALATSAAQTYFSEIKIGASFFVDGAIGANNPTADVEAEARDLWCEETGNLQPLVKCFVSIGTGHPGVGKGADKRVAHLLKILKQQATQTESMNQEFLGRWRDHVKRGKCFRFNVTHGLEHVRLQEYEEQGQLQSATTAYLVEHETKTRVRICVENLRSKSFQSTMVSTEALIEEMRDPAETVWPGTVVQATPSEIKELMELGRAQLNIPLSSRTLINLISAHDHFAKALSYQRSDLATPSNSKKIARVCQKLMETLLAMSHTAHRASQRKSYADQAQTYGEEALARTEECGDECMIAQMRFSLACLAAWKLYLEVKTTGGEGGVSASKEKARLEVWQTLGMLCKFPQLNQHADFYNAQADKYQKCLDLVL